MSISPSDHMAITDASAAGVSRLAATAESGRSIVLERHHVPVAAVIGYGDLQRLENLERDLTDLTLVLTRTATDTGSRTTLDDAIEAMGYTREQLDALPEPN